MQVMKINVSPKKIIRAGQGLHIVQGYFNQFK